MKIMGSSLPRRETIWEQYMDQYFDPLNDITRSEPITGLAKWYLNDITRREPIQGSQSGTKMMSQTSYKYSYHMRS